jgi:hypothetical protein
LQRKMPQHEYEHKAMNMNTRLWRHSTTLQRRT